MLIQFSNDFSSHIASCSKLIKIKTAVSTNHSHCFNFINKHRYYISDKTQLFLEYNFRIHHKFQPIHR